MKAVVVELQNDFAAVLSDDGCVTTVKNNNYEVGQIIQIKKRSSHLTKKISAFAASAAAFAILGTGVWAYASPYTYVSVDVNPSIEFSVNRFDRVIDVTAVNDDGDDILEDISLNDLKNETISNALVNTIEQISEAGYFDSETEGGIVITTSSSDMTKAEELATDLAQDVEQKTAQNGDSLEIEVFSVNQERVEKAKELGVTPGKLNLVEKLQAASGNSASVNLEEWLDKPVKDIMKATKEYKTSIKSTLDTEKQENVLDSETDEDTNQSTKEKQKIKNSKKEKKDKTSKSVKSNSDAKTSDSINKSGNNKKKTIETNKNQDKNINKGSKPDEKKTESNNKNNTAITKEKSKNNDTSDDSTKKYHSSSDNKSNIINEDIGTNTSDSSSDQSDSENLGNSDKTQEDKAVNNNSDKNNSDAEDELTDNKNVVENTTDPEQENSSDSNHIGNSKSDKNEE